MRAPNAEYVRAICITNPFLNHLDEQIPDNCVEVARDVALKNCRDRSRTYHSANLIQRILCTASRAESIGALKKILLIDRVQKIDRRHLNDCEIGLYQAMTR